MKKVAIISPINRTIIDGENIRSLEAIYLHKYLTEKNCDAYYIGKKVKETSNKYIDISKLDSLNDFNEIYIHNFNTNFFGGVVGALTTKFLKLIKDYNGVIYYYITDPKLKYTNIATDILKRKNCKFEEYMSVDELKKIEKALDFHQLRFKALFTGYNYTNDYGFETNSIEQFNVFYEISKNINIHTNDLFGSGDNINYDCCYYGDNRGSYRNNKIKKYFDTSSINTLLIGLELPLPNTHTIKKVDHSKLHTIVKQCHTSLVIGDKEHENTFATMRFYENIKFDVISFIDIGYDQNKVLFDDPTLKEFNYVYSQEDLVEKINKIKKDEQFKQTILNKQKQHLYGKPN